jgi:pyruvate/2-oxoglutarate dehydrogenase complex dihydrolipoamide acyltransferase (E2) component
MDPLESLSPAVRRLVRQFDLDITGIHGTGPDGRIRVGDVMGLLEGRKDSGNREVPKRAPEPGSVAEARDDEGVDIEQLIKAPAVQTEPIEAATLAEPIETPARLATPTTTIFDCDLNRVLSHRKKLHAGNVELLTTSYFLTALATALDTVPAVTGGAAPRFGVALTTSDGAPRTALLDMATVSWDAALDERVRAVDSALRANADADLSEANLLVHHYGESGSVLATPTAIGAGHAASVGIGHVRREVVVRSIGGTESLRITARCYLTLTFFVEDVPLDRANRVMAEAVRLLEQWPD